jgi:hypothetical protein
MAYGFRPVQMAGSRYQTGGFVKVPIEDDLIGTAIYNGGPVAYTIAATTAATGLSANDTPKDNDLSCGILVGATWENSAGEQKWGNYYDATGVAGKSFAFIVPLDGVIFQVQGSEAWDRKFTGWLNLVAGSTGSTSTGLSNISLTLAAANGSNAAIIPVGVLENGNETSSTPDVLVRFAAAGIQTAPLF